MLSSLFFILPNDDLMTEPQQTTGSRIKRTRQRKGLSGRALADKLKVTPTAVSDWENDKYNPNDENWAKLEEVLGVPRIELEHGFGADTQETFNAGVREGFRRAIAKIKEMEEELP